MEEEQKKYFNAFALVAVLTVFVLLSGQFFAKNTLWFDEAADAVSASHLFTDGVLRNYDGSFTVRAPFNPFGLAISYSLFGKSEAVLYAYTFVLALVSLSLIFIMTRRLFGTIAAAAGGFLLALSSLFVFYSARFLTEIPQILAVAFTLYFFFLVFEHKKFDLTPWIVVGAVIAFFAKPTLPAFFIPLALAVAFFYRKEFLELFGNRKAVCAAVLIAVVFAISVFAYNFAGTGSPVGLLVEYWQTTHVGQTEIPFEFYFTSLPALFSGLFVLALLLLGSAYAFWNSSKPAMILFLTLFVSLLIMSAATIFKDYRYVMFVFPAAYALAGFAVGTAASSVSLSLKSEDDAIKMLLAVFVFLALIATALDYQSTIAFTSSRVGSYADLRQVGDFVKNITSPEEIVLASAGPQLGYYADRRTVIPDYSNISVFLNQLEKTQARIIAIGIYEHPQEFADAFNKLQANQTQNPQNAFEYVFFNHAEFQPVRIFVSQQSPFMAVFKVAGK